MRYPPALSCPPPPADLLPLQQQFNLRSHTSLLPAEKDNDITNTLKK